MIPRRLNVYLPFLLSMIVCRCLAPRNGINWSTGTAQTARQSTPSKQLAYRWLNPKEPFTTEHLSSAGFPWLSPFATGPHQALIFLSP